MSIKLNDFKLNNEDFGRLFYLTNITPLFKFENGKATNERIGTKYEVALFEKKLEKIIIKVEGPQTLSDDLLIKKEMIKVVPEELEAYFYLRDGRPQISAKAKALKVVQ